MWQLVNVQYLSHSYSFDISTIFQATSFLSNKIQITNKSMHK